MTPARAIFRAAALVRHRIKQLQEVISDPQTVDPPIDVAARAASQLISLEALAPGTIHEIYDYLDRQHANRSRDPEARRMSRQLILAANLVADVSPAFAAVALKRLDLMSVDTAAPRTALSRALAPVMLAKILGLPDSSATSPALALLGDRVAATASMSASDPPTTQPIDYALHRWVPIPVATAQVVALPATK